MKKKTVFSLLAFASIFASAGVATLTTNVANAENDAAVQTATKEEFCLDSGAAVRFKEETASGLRFSATVSEAYITGLNAESIQYCMILAPEDSVENLADLTLETIEDWKGKAVYSTSAPDFTDEEETFTYYGSVIFDMTDWTDEEIEKAYTTSLVARPYLVVTKETGKEVVYADITSATERSMRQVVENAIEDLIEENENAPQWTQAEFDSVLSYTVNKDVKAFHEQGGTVKNGIANSGTLTKDVTLSVNKNSLTLVDGAAYAGQAVYVQGTETVDGETYVTMYKYGEIAADSAAKNATATRIDEAYDLPETALSATSNIFLYGTDGVVTTSFTEITQVIDTFAELQAAFDYSIYVNSWTAQGSKTGHYVLANDINNTKTYINYTNPLGASKVNSAATAATYAEVGFNGIFDGLGHSLSIYTGGGLFCSLLEDVQIRNVAFKNIKVYAQDNVAHNPIGDASTTFWLHPNDNGKRGSLSNVYISFETPSYAYKHSALPSHSGWLDMENIVVDLDYTDATTVAEGSSPTAGIYVFNVPTHSLATTAGVTTGTPAVLDNVHVFVRNCNETTAKYTYKTYSVPSWSVNAALDPEKFPLGQAGANVYTKIGEYTSYADFANGVTSRDIAGNEVTTTAEESLAKFATSEYWTVVTVEDGDTTYSYPTWHK